MRNPFKERLGACMVGRSAGVGNSLYWSIVLHLVYELSRRRLLCRSRFFSGGLRSLSLLIGLPNGHISIFTLPIDG
jgi:hypothetical protein